MRGYGEGVYWEGKLKECIERVCIGRVSQEGVWKGEKICESILTECIEGYVDGVLGYRSVGAFARCETRTRGLKHTHIQHCSKWIQTSKPANQQTSNKPAREGYVFISKGINMVLSAREYICIYQQGGMHLSPTTAVGMGVSSYHKGDILGGGWFSLFSEEERG